MFVPAHPPVLHIVGKRALLTGNNGRRIPPPESLSRCYTVATLTDSAGSGPVRIELVESNARDVPSRERMNIWLPGLY